MLQYPLYDITLFVQPKRQIRDIFVNFSSHNGKEALAIRRIFSLVDIITKAKFSNSPNDFKVRLFG